MKDRNGLIQNFLEIESWAFKGRHLVETMNEEKLKQVVKRIKNAVVELEIKFKIDEEN